MFPIHLYYTPNLNITRSLTRRDAMLSWSNIIYIFLLFSLVSVQDALHSESTSIVDLLSSSPNFFLLIRHLQRDRFIPYLNRNKGLTFFAPLNEAFDDDTVDPVWPYHILNTTDFNRTVFATEFKAADGQPIALKVTHKGESNNPFDLVNDVYIVRPNWQADSGIVQVVDQLLRLPQTALDILSSESEYSIFYRLSSAWVGEYESTTLFVPTTDVFINTFTNTELSYMYSIYATEDVKTLFNQHSVIHERVYADDVVEPKNFTLRNGFVMTMRYDKPNKILYFNDTPSYNFDLVTRNGAIHVLPDLLNPEVIVFTPAKYLIGLGATWFSEKISQKREDAAIDTSSHRGIFAPTNWAFRESSDIDYHIMENFYMPNINKYYLAKTNSKSHDEHNALIRVATDTTGALYVNFDSHSIDRETIGNVSLFLLEKDIEPPRPLLSQLILLDEISMSVRYLAALGLGEDPNSTWFLIENDAWMKLGLIRKALEHNMEMMQNLFLEYVFQGKHYFGSSEDSWTSGNYTTISGKSVMIENCPENNDIIYINGLPYEVQTRDMLVQEGVVHILNRLVVPFPVSQRSMISAGERKEFLELIDKQGLTDTLDQGLSIVVPPLSTSDIKSKDFSFADRHIIDTTKKSFVIHDSLLSVDNGPWVHIEDSGFSSCGNVYFVKSPIPTRRNASWRTFGVSLLGFFTASVFSVSGYKTYRIYQQKLWASEREPLLMPASRAPSLPRPGSPARSV
ncbi:fasciclin domain-containing protein [Schizosaccharomyces octosporus yFS286]|uniref:Fasciclin domain-containing protein n=1 Tax=Schizosaccharomyces octosporus (strain yFS286) TaxID=483514 RepID=S9RL08_SCHOY|nr:fasciclin domain-containing protein [Schizosaccharomyces octosporus yFS286]EPX74609.1 fasciclin domain-containing protein [Schizosaccharomyces octosporus yFS286]